MVNKKDSLVNEPDVLDNKDLKNNDLTYNITQYFENANNKVAYRRKRREFKKELLNKIQVKYISEWNNQYHISKLYNFLVDEFSIKYTESFINGEPIVSFYIQDPVSMIYKELTPKELNTYVNVMIQPINNNLELTKISSNLIERLQANYDMFDEFKPLPSHYGLFVNGIYQCKKNKFIPSDDKALVKIFEKYDFIKVPILTYIKDPKSLASKFDVWVNYINELASGDEDQIKLFKQIIYATFEGNGRKKYIMMSGTPGSGKSTFGRILEHIAGSEHTVYHTMDKFDDHNSLNRIRPDTSLILGDDLQKAARLSGEALRLYKSLIDGNAVSLNVKFAPNKIVRTSAVWLQMMNDLPSIHEANDAIKDRTLLVLIKGKNHRATKDLEERSRGKLLDLYTGKLGQDFDLEFFSLIISCCLQDIEYFDEFNVSEQMKQDTEQMVDDANWAKLYVDTLKDYGLHYFEKLPVQDLYKLLEYWIKENNPSMSMPSLKKFNQEIRQYLLKLGFELKSNTFAIPSDPIIYDRQLASILSGHNLTFLNKNKCSMWVKQQQKTKDDLLKLKAQLLEEIENGRRQDELSPELRIVAEYCILREFNPIVIDWKGKQT